MISSRYFAAALFMLLTCCSGEDAGWSSESGKVQTVDELRLVQSHEGVRDWMLTGDSAVYREEDSLLLITGVDIVFYENDLPESFLESDTGSSDLMSGVTVLWGNVFAENLQGRTLTTDLLYWCDSLGTFQTDCLVTFTIPESTGTTTLLGRGVTFDTGLSAVGDITVEESFTAVTTGEIPVD
ncbi:MAG TPA: LPS export ABC transporter periplasmic protein LptC [Candidatus Sabulitectum sp.]|nr:LPS export ABC transporter periplasmic protein LptC [Candidatus Sabulitectum sp.]HPR21815.1 LPS export ABC transporter periplasmic protein LptC [Candidatus Sabulitectum sp.]HRW77467.1 LPS export ABC transporter periplasmic protein LptC [Candidatus Sabulitectum sp.]